MNLNEKEKNNNEIINTIKSIRACIYSLLINIVQINVSRNRPKIRLLTSKHVSSTLIVNIYIYI